MLEGVVEGVMVEDTDREGEREEEGERVGAPEGVPSPDTLAAPTVGVSAGVGVESGTRGSDAAAAAAAEKWDATNPTPAPLTAGVGLPPPPMPRVITREVEVVNKGTVKGGEATPRKVLMRVTPPPVTTVKLSVVEINDRRENTRERFPPLGLLSVSPQLEDPYS